MMRRSLWFGTVLVVLVGAISCQTYQYAFQPLINQEVANLRFSVTAPSEADLLFVVDNSSSTAEEQAALASAFGDMITELSARDTSYRIAMVSTDVRGVTQDFNGTPLDPVPGYPLSVNGIGVGARGVDAVTGIEIRRPVHDGAIGRAIAAYDSAVFASALYPVLDTAEEATAFNNLVPTGAATGPVYVNGEQGVPHVIDRDLIERDACVACNAIDLSVCDPSAGSGCVPECNPESPNFEVCAQDVATALVEAFFRSNLRGLGTTGGGWEEGMLAASLAAGIDIRESNLDTAIRPGNSATRPGGPNTYAQVDASGALVDASWIREDALFAVLFVSDEEDCSMPETTLRQSGACNPEVVAECGTRLWEDQGGAAGRPILPLGSICYQEITNVGGQVPTLVQPDRAASVFTAFKGGQGGRVAMGFIGSLQTASTAIDDARFATATDCATDASLNAVTDCACLTNAQFFNTTSMTVEQDTRWCCFTGNATGCSESALGVVDPGGVGLPTCDAIAGNRYIDLTNSFARRTFASVCQQAGSGFGPAMTNFAQIATLACFELNDIQPFNNDADNIVVLRAARDQALTGTEPTLLTQQADSNTTEEGWYYDQATNSICLTGLDRLIGDVYDITIVTADTVDFTQ